jgi:hypothetical protein
LDIRNRIDKALDADNVRVTEQVREGRIVVGRAGETITHLLESLEVSWDEDGKCLYSESPPPCAAKVRVTEAQTISEIQFMFDARSHIGKGVRIKEEASTIQIEVLGSPVLTARITSMSSDGSSQFSCDFTRRCVPRWLSGTIRDSIVTYSI